MFSLPYLLFKLADIASEMREAQKDYYRTRSAGNLAHAKKLELSLDKCLRLIKENPDFSSGTFKNSPEPSEP